MHMTHTLNCVINGYRVSLNEMRARNRRFFLIIKLMIKPSSIYIQHMVS